MPLSSADYLLGAVELAAVVAAIGFGAFRVRAWLLPGWSGAPARLVESVIGIAGLIWVAELLGAIGEYNEVPLVVEAVVVGLGAGVLARRATRPASGPRMPAPPGPAPPRYGVWIAVIAAAVVAAHWSVAVHASLTHGMYGYDTTWYHMPFAARFVQASSLTELHFTSTSFLSWFYPANSELLHSVGILITGRDYLSPLINFGWLGLTLLAAWCIGRPWGLGPVSLVGVCVVLGAGVFGDQPGEARNDTAATFFLLASAAVLINATMALERDRRRPLDAVARLDPGVAPLCIAALAAGLALGTKLSLLAPIAALTVAIVFAARRRLPAAAIWAGGLLAGGGFWFIRNLVAVGNPLPWLSALGPLPLPGPEEVLPNEREPFSVFHYATDTSVWRDWFFPGLADQLGDLWPLVLVLGLAGAALLLLRDRFAVLRVLGFVVVTSAVAYLFTPLTASGLEDKPIGFASNLRYLGPVLALGLALVCVALRDRAHSRQRLAFALLVLVLAVALAGHALRYGFGYGIALMAAAVVVGWLALKLWRSGRVPRLVVAAAVAIAAILSLAAGYRVQRNYLEDRYATEYGIGEPGLESAFIWARDVGDARIATITIRQYPYYGGDLSNHVQYVGLRGSDDSFTPITSCNAWRRAVNDGDYDYVVTASNIPSPEAEPPPEAGWTGDDKGAKEIVHDGPTSVFKLDGELDPADC